MSLIVETGSGSPIAESYASVAEALALHEARGNTSWSALGTTAQEQALRNATAYMVGEYRMRWSGVRLTTDQSLDWPRSLVPRRDTAHGSYYPNDSVPTEVKTACILLALRASRSTLLKDQTQRKASMTVGPITTTYEAGSKAATTYAEVDAILRPFLSIRTGQIRLVRQ